MFPAIVTPDTRKIIVPVAEGLREYRLKKRVKPGVWIFEEQGFDADPIREAEIWEKVDAYDALKLPQVAAVAALKTKTWFCFPLNDNQWAKHIKHFSAPTPLLFAPEDLSVFDYISARIHKLQRPYLLYEGAGLSFPEQDDLRNKLKQVTRTTDLDRLSSELPYRREVKRVFRLVAEQYIPPLERVIKEALRIVNAKFVDLVDRGRGRYEVAYEYKGRRNSVTVNEDLVCLDAGICLSGRDTDFDLSSVVLVKARRYYNDDD